MSPPAATPAATPLRWPSEALWEQLHPRLPGFTVEVLAQVDSTNEELMRRARSGDTAPTLLVAEHQSAGRGRRGRAWHSAPGQSLTASLGLALAPADWSGLSLVVGVALAEALHADVHIKWPNDLCHSGAKLGGILVETASMAGGRPASARYAVIGFGINIVPPTAPMAHAPGAPAPQPATGLLQIAPEWTAPRALAAVAPALVDALQLFEAQGFAPFVRRFRARDMLAGQQVDLWANGETPVPVRKGLCLGVAPSGALRIQDDRGTEHLVLHGEVSVRPSRAPGGDAPAPVPAPATSGG